MTDPDADLVRLLSEHDTMTTNLATPRQYTQHGGWNMNCACGYPVGDPGDGSDEGYERVHAAHRAHLADVLTRAGYRKVPDAVEVEEWAIGWAEHVDGLADFTFYETRTDAATSLAKSAFDGRIIHRTRTSFPDVVSEWEAVES